jgi:hypothetical protein
VWVPLYMHTELEPCSLTPSQVASIKLNGQTLEAVPTEQRCWQAAHSHQRCHSSRCLMTKGNNGGEEGNGIIINCKQRTKRFHECSVRWIGKKINMWKSTIFLHTNNNQLAKSMEEKTLAQETQTGHSVEKGRTDRPARTCE